MAFFLILGLMVIPIMVENIGQLADDVPGWIDDVNEYTQREFDVQLIPDTAIRPSQSSVGLAKNFVSDYGGALVGAVGGLVGAIFAVFTIALFVFYMTSNAPRIRRSVVSLLRPERQRDVLWAWNVALEKTGGYLYQRILLAVINSSLMSHRHAPRRNPVRGAAGPLHRGSRRRSSRSSGRTSPGSCRSSSPWPRRAQVGR